MLGLIKFFPKAAFRYLLPSILLVSQAGLTVQADPDTGAADTDSAQTDNAGGDSGSGGRTVLQGGVKGAALLVEDGLSMIGTSAKMVQVATEQVIKEVTRKETVNMGQPNYIGNGIVIPAIGGPTGTTQMGNLPARRKKVEAFVSSTTEAMAALQNHVSALIIPEVFAADVNPIWTKFHASMKVAEDNLALLKDAAQEEQLDNKKIGKAALKIYDSMTAMEKMKNEMVKIVKKDAK